MMAWKMEENKIFVLEFEPLCAAFENTESWKIEFCLRVRTLCSAFELTEDWESATGFRVRTPKIGINQRSNAKKKNPEIALGVRTLKIQRNQRSNSRRFCWETCPGILVITFYSDVRLIWFLMRWKEDFKFYNFTSNRYCLNRSLKWSKSSWKRRIRILS